MKLAVVSNGGRDVQTRKIAALGIARYLSHVVISEAVGLRKPDPRIFHLALAALGVVAGRTWFVGDHPHFDVSGAEACGMTAVWLRGYHAWPRGQPPPTARITRISDLLELLAACRCGQPSEFFI